MSISVDGPHNDIFNLEFDEADLEEIESLASVDSAEDWSRSGQRDFDDVEPTRVMSRFSDGFFFADRFQIHRVLGSGGMGTVYEATDMLSDQRVALKVLKKKKASDESAARFRREAEILSAIEHPGIVGIHGFGGAADGTLWLAMEYLDGETLREYVAKRGPQDPVSFAPILRALCDALAATHARGVVHRDLKPDNIFLTADEPPQPKILDFGLSLALSSKKLTQTGTVIGTPRYMAPEQIKSAHAADAQADIYALGVITYEVLTGQSPFAASDQGQLLGAILTGRKQPLHEVNPEYPEALEDTLVQAMAPKTEDRYQTPAEFVAAFEDAAEIYDALRATPEPHRVSGKPTLRMDGPPPGAERGRDDETTRKAIHAPTSFRENLPKVARVPKMPDDDSEIPRWMIPFVVLGGFAIMGLGAALAYWFIHAR